MITIKDIHRLDPKNHKPDDTEARRLTPVIKSERNLLDLQFTPTALNHFTLSALISNCSRKKVGFTLIQNIYQFACDSRQANVVTHNSYITAAGNCGQFDEAQRAYGAASRFQQADVVTHASYITAAGNCGQFDAAQRAYSAACENFQANVVTHASYITAAGNCGQFAEAQRAYSAACESHQADVVTHASYITAAGSCGQFAEALHIFDESTITFQYKNAGAITSAWLDIIMQDMRCFLQLHFMNKLNRQDFSSAYERNKIEFPLSDIILRIALHFDKVYTSLSDEQVNSLVQFMQHYVCDIEKLRITYALEIFYAQHPHLVQPEHGFAPLLYGLPCPVIDLHGYSKGEALLMCEIAFNQHKFPGATLICGKGLHSRDNVSVLGGVIKEFCEKKGITCQYDGDNFGRIICQ